MIGLQGERWRYQVGKEYNTCQIQDLTNSTNKTNTVKNAIVLEMSINRKSKCGHVGVTQCE